MRNPVPPQPRNLGKFEISAGTSLALEGLLGLHEGVTYSDDDKYPYKRFDVIAINVRTLIRNSISSYTSADVLGLQPMQLAELIKDEMRTIVEIVKSHTRKKLSVYYYLPKYSNLKKLFPHAKIKLPTTGRQQALDQLENETIAALEMDTEIPATITLNQPTFPPEFTSKRLIYLTHQISDILYTPYGHRELLESYTGKIKPKSKFTTKLNSIKDDASNVPFDRMTLQMFADRSNMFTPYPANYRRELLGVAKKFGWNSTTSKEKIIENCKMYKNNQLTNLVTSLYRG